MLKKPEYKASSFGFRFGCFEVDGVESHLKSDKLEIRGWKENNRMLSARKANKMKRHRR